MTEHDPFGGALTLAELERLDAAQLVDVLFAHCHPE
jgi:hypothetical protein